LTIVVLLILAMVWLAVLGPGLLRRRAERRSTDSIGAFHRQLRVLERTGPVLVDPAYRLDADSTADAGSTALRLPRPQRPARRTTAAKRAPRHAAERRTDPYFRPEACRRRRNVLVGLVAVLVCTGFLGVAPALRPTLFVTLVDGLLLAGYVGLLVYLRTLALERQVKLRYLPRPAEADISVAFRRAVSR
jgi:hypothetical protein